MDKVEAELEQRVWKRVRGQEQESQPQLQALAAAELTEAAVYLMLSRQVQGNEKAMLRRLFEEEQAHADCLRGMHTMITGQRLVIRTASTEPDTPETALRKSYGRKLRTIAEYMRRAEDREYGGVFAALAEQEKAHCRMILEILGRLKR